MNATDTIKEALREYVGDGDGADEQVLAEHDARVADMAVGKYRRRQRRVIVVMWVTIALNLTAATLNLLSR